MRALFAVQLVLVAGCARLPQCLGALGFLFDEKRPDTFWDGAATTALAPSDLRPAFESLSGGKYVWTLAAGDYQMPYHMSQVPFNSSLRLVGVGRNTTNVQFKGWQRVLVLQPGCYIEFANLTISGMTVGYFDSATTDRTSPNEYPRLGLFSSEFWAVTSDNTASNGHFLDIYFTVARTYGALTTVGSSAKLTTAIVNDTTNTVSFPLEMGVYIFQTRNSDMNLGILHAYFEDVVQRENPDGTEMENLYNDMVAQRGAPFSTDCWNATLYDLGFTYRGNVSTTVTGYACKAWDDPSTFPSLDLPAAPGKWSSTQANYCRSNRFWPGGPWCFTTNPATNALLGFQAWELCDIPVCPGTNLSASSTGGGSSGIGVGGIIGIVIAAVFVVLAAAAVAWWLCCKQPAPLVKDADKDSLLHTQQPQVWHVRRPFETIMSCPFMKQGMEVASHPQASSKTPGDLGPPILQPVSFRPQVLQMLERCRSVDSLAPRDLAYKFGPRWAAENEIDTTRLIGAGGIGKVYAGLSCGEPVAYKVINQLKTLEAMLRFVRKCVLPVVNVQLMSSFPSDHCHLLQLRDCLMFPQYSSLLILAGEYGDSFNPNKPRRYLPGAGTAADGAPANSLAAAQPPSDTIAVTIDPALQANGIDAAISVRASAKLPSIEPTWVSRSKAVELPAAIARSDARTPSGGDACGLNSSVASVYETCSLVQPQDAADNFLSAASSTPSASVNAKQTQLSANSLGASATPRSVPGAGTDGGKGRNGGARAQASPRSAMSERHSSKRRAALRTNGSLAGYSDGEGQATRDIVVQIIMVSPLCELGTLTDLLRCRTLIPVKALPDELQSLLERMGFRTGPSAGSLNVGDVQVTIQEDQPSVPVAEPIGTVVSLQELPTLWQIIFKLQLSLQILEGVAALHAVSLIHCDIKLDNIFITYSKDFAPFRVCAKIGDLDTCRSLTGAHLLRSPSGLGQSVSTFLRSDETMSTADTASMDFDPHAHFTSCLKGTPGFLAPEMISIGRVSSETDIFSLAVTVSIMLSVRSHFYKLNDLHLKLITDFYRDLDEDLKKCLTECLSLEPSRRPGLAVLKQHLQAELQACLEKAAFHPDYYE